MAHMFLQEILTPCNNQEWAMLNRLNFEGIIHNETGKYFVKEPQTPDQMISVRDVYAQFRQGKFGRSKMDHIPVTFTQPVAEPVTINPCRRRWGPLDSPRRPWVTRREF